MYRAGKFTKQKLTITTMKSGYIIISDRYFTITLNK